MNIECKMRHHYHLMEDMYAEGIWTDYNNEMLMSTANHFVEYEQEQTENISGFFKTLLLCCMLHAPAVFALFSFQNNYYIL